MTKDANLEKLKIDAVVRESGASPVAGPRRSRRRLVAGILVVLFLVLLAAAAVFLSSGARRVETFTVPASEASRLSLLAATGYIVARDPISISPEVSGRILTVGPDVGETVAAGQLLFEIDSTFYRADYGAAEARRAELARGFRREEKERARAVRDEVLALARRAEADYARALLLVESGAISRSDLDRFRADRDSTRSRLAAAENDLKLVEMGPRVESVSAASFAAESLRNSLERTRVLSPISGLVVSREVTPGEYVIAGQGVGLRDATTPPPYVVADLSRMEAVVEISERDITRVSVGLPAVVRPDALPDSGFLGVVTRINPSAYRQKGTIEIRVDVENPSPLLKHEMNCRVEFTTDPAAFLAAAIRVPARALRTDDKGSFVLVLETDGHVARRDVKSSSGADERDEVIIDEGLLGGEILVLDPGVEVGDTVE